MKTIPTYRSSEVALGSDLSRLGENKLSRIVAIAASCAVLISSAHSQDESEEIYELSPFTIDSSDSAGYVASSTLAGTRLNTPLKDIASSITVVTKDFLEDTQSTDLKELLIYTPNTEVIGPIGNLADEAGQTGENTISENRVRINATTRVRGLASATLTRGLYESIIPMDTFNTDRVTMNRGANSILFGVGSPAGIIDTSVIAPVFANRTELSGRYGSYGSYRGTFDLERVLVEGKLSVRVAGLAEDTKFQQKPAFERDRRLFASVSWRPSEDLSLNFNSEQGDIATNLPRQFPAVNYLAVWFDPDAHPDGLVQPSLNPNTTNAFGPYSKDYFGPFGPIFRPVAIWDDPSSGTVTGVNGVDAMLVLKHQNWHLPGSPNRDHDWWGSTRGTGRNQISYRVPRQVSHVDGQLYRNDEILVGYDDNGDPLYGSIAAQFTNGLLRDDTVLDFRNNVIDGNTKRDLMKFDTYNFSVEKLFWDNNLGIELAYDGQRNSEERRRLLQGGRSDALMADVNTFLPDGSPNPNFGRPLVGWTEGRWDKTSAESDVFRATAFAKMDFADRTDGILRHFVGSHTLTGLYEDREASNFLRGGPQYSWGAEYANFGERDNGTFINASLPRPSGWRGMAGLVYLGDSLFGASSPAGANIQASVPDIQIADSYTVRGIKTTQDEWQTRTISVERDAVTSGSRDRLERETEALVISSRFADNHIIATYGWRKDTIDSFAETAPISPTRYALIDDADFQVLDTASGDPFSDSTFSWGVVAHTPHSWVENLPVSSLSVHYASAENRVASSRIRHNVFGEDLPSPLGETEEKGFSFGLLENRVNIKATWYETIQANRTETDLGALNGLINFEISRTGGNAIEVVEENLYNQDDIEDLLNYPPLPQVIVDAWDIRDDGSGNDILIATAPDNLRTTSDAVSEGFELEAVGSITSNWTLSFNATKQKVARNNTAPDWERYLYGEFNRAALWTDDAFGKFPSATGNFFSIGDRMNNLYLAPYNLAKLQDGSGSSDQIREWRYNLFTNYRFNSDSRLKGFTIGGGGRWQDEVAIGYPQIYNEDIATFIPDVTRPIYGGSEFNADGFVRYQRPIRDGKVDMTLTLNIRNLFDEDDLIPVKANPNEGSDGIIAVWRIPTERTYALTARFNF